MATKILVSLLLLALLSFHSSATEPRRGGEEEEKGKPFVFGAHHFKNWTKSEYGHFKVLPRFSERSPLLFGVDNFRLALLRLEPLTIAVPSHWDASEIFYVMKGCGIISLLLGERKESYHIKQGDIMWIPAGAQVYAINKDNSEKLEIAILVNPISIPGRFREFYAAGGRHPESLYRVFSREIIEAALNAPWEEIERIFDRQTRGSMFGISEEQIKAISRHAERGGGSIWPFGQSKNPFNLLEKRPEASNQHGKLNEANAEDYWPLRELDVDISVIDITKGSMMMLHYNSNSIMIALAIRGWGEFQMACPHISEEKEEEVEEEEEGQGRRYYQQISSIVSPETVMVVPVGHPIIFAASSDENLVVLSFGIRAHNNKKIFLSGMKNVLKKLEKEVKEVTFRWPAREVDKVLGAQNVDIFGKGPEKRRRGGEGGGSVFESVVDFAGF